MKKLKLVIISVHIKNSPQGFPLAAALLKSQLDSVPEIKERLDVSFIDFYTEMSPQYIAEKISSESPDFTGFSTYLWNSDLIGRVCTLLKEKLPETVLFAGGAEAAAQPEKLLSIAPFDFVIMGEGEIPITEVMRNIINNKPYDQCKGVFVKGIIKDRENGECHVADLNSIPSPFLTGAVDIKQYSGLLWELSRGCPFKCSFCFESKGVPGVRHYSLERIKRELELFESQMVTQIFVLDPTFNRDIKRAKTILRMIQKIAPLIHFTFEVRTEFIDREMAELFASINCSLQIGLQSALPDVLANVNRKFDPENYAEKISLLNSEGVIFGMDLIYGLPGDTLEGFIYSLNYTLRLQPNHVDIFPLALLPGTVLYDMADSFNLNYLHEPPYTLISSPGYSLEDMNEAESLANACDIFYNRGGAAGWMFMILETLNIQPAQLLKSFASYLNSNNIQNEITGNEITSLQIAFVRELFTAYGINKFSPVMEDIILINGALNLSLYAGAYPDKNNITVSDESIFKISLRTVLLNLKYNFDALLTVGELNFEEFLNEYSPEETYAVIYNCCGEVKPLILNKSFYKLLLSFNGELSLKEILDKNQFPDRNAVNNFLEYALTETVIHSVNS